MNVSSAALVVLSSLGLLACASSPPGPAPAASSASGAVGEDALVVLCRAKHVDGSSKIFPARDASGRVTRYSVTPSKRIADMGNLDLRRPRRAAGARHGGRVSLGRQGGPREGAGPGGGALRRRQGGARREAPRLQVWCLTPRRARALGAREVRGRPAVNVEALKSSTSTSASGRTLAGRAAQRPLGFTREMHRLVGRHRWSAQARSVMTIAHDSRSTGPRAG